MNRICRAALLWLLLLASPSFAGPDAESGAAPGIAPSIASGAINGDSAKEIPRTDAEAAGPGARTSRTDALPATNAAASRAEAAEALQRNMEQLIGARKATVGVAVLDLADGEAISVNGSRRFPMQSVFKFHIALAVLAEVEKGKLFLQRKFRLTKADLRSHTWSPIRDAYPQGVELSLAEILAYTVGQSDNNGCDFLLRLVGGPKTVEAFIRAQGIRDIAIELDEEDMHRNWNAQFRNWTTPDAAVALLAAFHEEKILRHGPRNGWSSANASVNFLTRTMLETVTGAKRLKGKLPPETPVAHKTGTSGRNAQGVFAATNDIGIVSLPDGRQFAIAVFVANSEESEADNETIIADIARLAWDYWLQKGQ